MTFTRLHNQKLKLENGEILWNNKWVGYKIDLELEKISIRFGFYKINGVLIYQYRTLLEDIMQYLKMLDISYFFISEVNLSMEKNTMFTKTLKLNKKYFTVIK